MKSLTKSFISAQYLNLTCGDKLANFVRSRIPFLPTQYFLKWLHSQYMSSPVTSCVFTCYPSWIRKSFLNTKSAVQLTQASNFFCHTLRHQIRRTQHYVRPDRFIQQSHSQAKHIGLCSFVRARIKIELDLLLQHVANEKVIKRHYLGFFTHSHLE